MISFSLYRDILGDDYTLGELKQDGLHFSYTCEDKDRQLESGGTKVYGETAIPRGHYKLGMKWSPHFKRNVVWIMDVPQFSDVYFHGGNKPEDSLGCVLHGRVRDEDGPSYISDCKERVEDLEDIVSHAVAHNEEVWLDVE